MVAEVTRIVGKGELAEALGYTRAYFFRLVHKNKVVYDGLMRVGYKRNLKSLSPMMIDVICSYYGYPLCINKD